jgi:hypothetical protein
VAGEKFLTALRAYYEVFFAEEENRIRPALEEGLERARNLADGMSFSDLLEELSQGVILEEVFKTPNLVLTPSFWGSPLLILDQVAEDREIILFGARPQWSITWTFCAWPHWFNLELESMERIDATRRGQRRSQV